MSCDSAHRSALAGTRLKNSKSSAARGDFAQARSDARYIERTTGTRQKLCYANYEGDL